MNKNDILKSISERGQLLKDKKTGEVFRPKTIEDDVVIGYDEAGRKIECELKDLEMFEKEKSEFEKSLENNTKSDEEIAVEYSIYAQHDKEMEKKQDIDELSI